MIRSGLYNILGGGIRLIVTLLSLPLMIKLLGTTTYGMFAIANSVAAFVTIAESSIVLAITVFITRANEESENDPSHYNEIINSCFQATFILSLLLFFLFYISASYVALFFIESNLQQQIILQSALRLCAGLGAVRLLQQFFTGLIQARRHYGSYNAISTVYSILVSGGSVLVAYWHPDLRDVFSWQMLIALLFLGYYYYYCRRYNLLPDGPLKLTVRTKFLKPILIHCGRTWPGLFGGVLFAQGDRLIVGRLLGLETVGIYSVLTSVVNQINIFSAMPVQPIVAYLRNTGNVTKHTSIETQRLVGEAISVNTGLATLLGLSVICFAPELAGILIPLSSSYSPEKIAALLALLGAIYAIYSMNAVGYYTLFAVNRETLNSIIVLLCGLITIITISLLAYKIGLFGAVIGNAGYLTSLSLLFIAYRQVKIERWLLIRTYVIAILILLVALVITLVSPLLLIRAGVFVAGCVMLLLIHRHYARQLFALWAKFVLT